MKKFIINGIIFILPVILLINLPKLVPFTFHDDLNRKMNTFIDENDLPDIIIGGDSRAERQLIPQIFKKRLDLKTVNIAVNSGDVTMLYNALKKKKLLDDKFTLIISVSSIETNDNVINEWGIPHAELANIPFIDNMKLFGDYYFNVLHERIRLMFKEFIKFNAVLSENDDRVENEGFMGIKGDITKWDFKNIDINQDTLKVGWYLNAENNGSRKEVFKKMIGKYSQTDMNIILFQPPISPSWYNYTKDTYIDSIELDHSEFLKDIADSNDNISFIDFYTNYSSVYNDSMFYNSVHFNIGGAEIFSNMLIDSLMSRNLVNIDSTDNTGPLEWEYLE